MSRPWILISPSSRGIGLALARHLLHNTTVPILATARGPDLSATRDRILQGEGTGTPRHRQEQDDGPGDDPGSRLSVVALDVTDEPTIEAASRRAARLFPADTHHLRLAFAVPGVLRPEKSPRRVDAADALMTYRVNCLGPLLLMKWFGGFLPSASASVSASVPASVSEEEEEDGHDASRGGNQQQHQHHPVLRLPEHAVWLNMSARVGSTSDNRKGGWYSYRSSKAAVNSLTKTFDHHVFARSGDKAMAMAYHPGTVKTDLSRDYWGTMPEEQLFEPEYAVRKMVEVVTEKVGLQGRGRCWDWKGEEILP